MWRGIGVGGGDSDTVLKTVLGRVKTPNQDTCLALG